MKKITLFLFTLLLTTTSSFATTIIDKPSIEIGGSGTVSTCLNNNQCNGLVSDTFEETACCCYTETKHNCPSNSSWNSTTGQCEPTDEAPTSGSDSKGAYTITYTPCSVGETPCYEVKSCDYSSGKTGYNGAPCFCTNVCAQNTGQIQ